MNKDHKLTSLDNNQVARYSFNEELRANRVEIVGSEAVSFNLDTKPLEEAIKAGFLTNKAESPLATMKPEIQYREIKIPEIIREQKIQIVEVPTYLITKEIQTIEVPKTIVITEIKIVEIEKPVYITKIEYIDKPVIIEKVKNLNYLIIIQSLALIGFALKLFIK